MINQKYQYLFDVAANLSHFNNYDTVINKAISVKVNRFFLGGYTLQSNYKNLELCKLYPNNLFCGFGIHPYNVLKYDESMDKTMQEIQDLLSSNKNINIIGETGLDFSDNFPSPIIQIKWFEKHIEMALKLNKKLYIHERKAHKKLIEILEDKYKFNPENVLIHCFTGNKEELLYYVENGYNLSLSGFITKNTQNAKDIRDVLENNGLPIDKLMIESDAPYMHLNGEKRIKKLKLLDDKSVNEPVVLPYVLEKICKCYNDKYDMNTLSIQTTQNAFKFFF